MAMAQTAKTYRNAVAVGANPREKWNPDAARGFAAPTWPEHQATLAAAMVADGLLPKAGPTALEEEAMVAFHRLHRSPDGEGFALFLSGFKAARGAA